tara:strand:- start:1409 stop:3589 length:2181 start_codon:yes stop_codon:yes gene_type:complete
MRTILKSPLKKAANNISRIGFSPKARRVRAFDFDRRSEYVKFADFINNSSKELADEPLPSKRKLKKLANFEVAAGGGLGGLAGLLGGLGSLALGGLGFPGFNIPRPRFRLNNRRNRGNRRREERRRQRQQRRERQRQNRTRQRNRTRNTSREARRRYQRRFGGDAARRRFRNNVAGRQVRGIQRFTRPIARAGRMGLAGGRAVLRASKALMRGVSRIPIIGSIMAGVYTYFQDVEGGDDPNLPGGGPDGKPDMNLTKALFSAGGAALGGLLGSFIPIPVIGTLLGGIIGEYIGDLAYILVKGGGFQAVGQKLKDDLKKLLTVGSKVLSWAGRGFDRFKMGFPKFKLPKILGGFEVLDLRPGKIAEGVLKLPRAFFTNLPMNETKEQEAERLKREEELRKLEEKANKQQDSDQLPYTTTEDGEVVPIGPVDEPAQDLQLTPMSNTVNTGLTNIVPTANLMARGVGTGQAVTGVVGMTSGRGRRWGKHHAGVDIGTSGQAGWHVSFALNGIVTEAGTFGTYGKLVVITCGDRDFTFAHLKRIDVRKGQTYTGQIIGEIGNTGGGNNTGIHLHFEAAPKGMGGRPGNDLDPMPFVKYLRIGRLGVGSPQTQFLARENSDDGLVATTDRRGRQVEVNPVTGETREIATDPRRENQKTNNQQMLENMIQVIGLLATKPEEESKPQVATLPLPVSQQSGNKKEQTTTSTQQVSRSQALNSYWQATLFTKLSA